MPWSTRARRTRWEAIGGTGRLLDPARRSCSARSLLGLWVFNREAPRIAENL